MSFIIVDKNIPIIITIQMTQVERSLLEVNFPDFVTRFKDVCLDQLLPIIDQTIDEIRQADNSTLIVLLIILFVQLLRLALL